MKVILFIMIFTIGLMGQSDWSDFTVNYPDSLDDSTSLIKPGTGDIIYATDINKLLRAVRVMQEKMGVLGSDSLASYEDLYIKRPDMNYLYKWRSDLAADLHEQEGGDTISIMYLGDSHMAGIGKFLNYYAGLYLGNAGAGFISMQSPAGDAIAPFSGPLGLTCDLDSTGWKLYNSSDNNDELWGINGYAIISDSDNDTISFQTNHSVYNMYRIYYIQRSANAGSFSYEIDGTPVDTVDTESPGFDSLKYEEETLNDVGRHRLCLKTSTFNSAGDSTIIVGVEFINFSNSGARPLRLYHGGAYAKQTLDNVEYLQDFIAVADPSLILIHFGTNDTGYRTSTQYYSDMQGLIDSIEVATDASILVLSDQKQQGSAITDTLEVFRDKLLQLTQEQSVGFWDKWSYLPDWTTANSLGLVSDGTHSNTKSRLYICGELAKFLFEGYGYEMYSSVDVNNSQKSIVADGQKSSDLTLYRDSEYSAGIGWYIFGEMTGDYNAGLGYFAGYEQSGDHNISLGMSAGRVNTGNNNNFNGRNSGYNNTGTSCNFFGYEAGYDNTANYVNGFGLNAGHDNSGAYLNAFGRDAGYYNTGAYVETFGFRSGQYNTANFTIGMGYYSNQYNTGTYNISIGGLNTGRYNEGTNILLGRSVHDSFLDDTANQKAFADTDVSNDTITITGHGFGSNGTYRLLRFDEGTGVGGMTDDAIYKFKIVDANTIEAFGFSIGTPTAGSDTLTPQTNISNAIVIGHNVDPTASNQTTIGNTSTTQTIVYGDLQPETFWSTAIDSVVVDGDSLKFRVGANWYKMEPASAP